MKGSLIYAFVMLFLSIALAVLYWCPLVEDIHRDGLLNAMFIIFPSMGVIVFPIIWSECKQYKKHHEK